MQAGGDGFGWRVTAEHMTFQEPRDFVPRHVRKISEGAEKTKSYPGKEGQQRLGCEYDTILVFR